MVFKKSLKPVKIKKIGEVLFVIEKVVFNFYIKDIIRDILFLVYFEIEV